MPIISKKDDYPLTAPFNFFRTTCIFCAGGCLPLNIMLAIFMISFGIQTESVRIFAYISAVPCVNLLVNLFILTKAGYTRTPVSLCFILVFVFLWLAVIINAALCGYISYLVLSPLNI